MELPRQIPYNPRWGAMLFAAAFFGACSAVMAYEAVHNTKGIIVNGIITFGPAGAKVFYWAISAGGAGFVLMAALATLRGIASPKVLDFRTDALLLPHGFLQRQTSRIAYADIQNVIEGRVSGQTFLYVTAGGLRYTITASLLPDKETYAGVRAFLGSLVPQ